MAEYQDSNIIEENIGQNLIDLIAEITGTDITEIINENNFEGKVVHISEDLSRPKPYTTIVQPPSKVFFDKINCEIQVDRNGFPGKYFVMCSLMEWDGKDIPSPHLLKDNPKGEAKYLNIRELTGDQTQKISFVFEVKRTGKKYQQTSINNFTNKLNEWVRNDAPKTEPMNLTEYDINRNENKHFLRFEIYDDSQPRNLLSCMDSNIMHNFEVKNSNNAVWEKIGGESVELNINTSYDFRNKLKITIRATGKSGWWQEIQNILYDERNKCRFVTPPFPGDIELTSKEVKFKLELEIIELDFKYPNKLNVQYKGEKNHSTEQRTVHLPVELANSHRRVNTLKPESENYEKDYSKSQKNSGISNEPSKFTIAIKEIERIVEAKDKDLTAIINELKSVNEGYAINTPNGNTLFHETVETHEFVHISHIMEALEDPQDLFRNSFNDRYENLLHYACRLNKSMYIRPLIGFRCSVVDRDQNGRTPLHVALEYRHEGCLVEFKKIFENDQKYPHIRDELRQLFDVYNDKGETVLHTAVLNDQKDLVGAMLRFCLSEKINVCEIVRLTDGNTILHLAAIERFEDMQSLIVKYVENIKDYENYSGQTANFLSTPSINYNFYQLN